MATATRIEKDFLEVRTETRVRFSEVDSLRIAWHGHYLKYFEDAREAFGCEFGLTYAAIEQAGYLAPMHAMQVEYLAPARAGDLLEVTARLRRLRAAKLEFDYEVRRMGEGKVLARGTSMQVFLTHQWEMVLVQPKFLREFFRRHQP